jgi:hypothetical protein
LLSSQLIDGPGATERLREAGEHREVSVECDLLQSAHTERGEAL